MIKKVDAHQLPSTEFQRQNKGKRENPKGKTCCKIKSLLVAH